MEKIKQKLIEKLELSNNLDCDFQCYHIDGKRFIIFLQEEVNKTNIYDFLNRIEKECDSINFDCWKSFICVGNTKEEFRKHELLFFNTKGMFVTFYLINRSEFAVYMNDKLDGIFPPEFWKFRKELIYRDYVRKIDSIVKEYLIQDYCQTQLEDFKRHETYFLLKNLTCSLNLNLIIEVGKNQLKLKSNDLYLRVIILNQERRVINIGDDFLMAETKVVGVDRKGNLKFLTWKEKQFVGRLNWLIEKLKV